VKTLSQSLSRAAKIERDWIFIEGTNAKGRVLTSKTPLPLPKLDAALAADISAVSQIDAVASILEVIWRTTGMGFAAVARVTQDRWIAYAVRDEIAFGLTARRRTGRHDDNLRRNSR